MIGSRRHPVVSSTTWMLAALVVSTTIPASSEEWSEAAAMNVPRQYPGVARLPDGRILAVTGHPLGGKSLESAEIYDPAANSWTQTGSLNVPRNGVSPDGLIVLRDGRILIAGGGSNRRSVHEAELYDPTTGAWSRTGSMHEPRANHTTTHLSDGRVLVTGGIDWTTDKVLSSAETYDPDSETWTVLSPMAIPRTNHSAALLEDGRVLIAGGARVSDVEGELSEAEIFDPASGTFRLTAPMHDARRAFRAVRLHDGRVLAIGGAWTRPDVRERQLDSVEIFDPVTETWARTGSLAEGRWGPDVALLSDGRVLATGGMFGRVGRRRSAEIFDPATEVWSSAGSLNRGRNGHRSITLDDGRILIIGGYSAGTELTSCEIYEE